METETGKKTRPFLIVQDLSKRFGAAWALARANFSLERGQLVLLTGDNGSGKTTLIRCLSTALVPDFGRAAVDGNDLVLERDTVRKLAMSLHQPPGFYGGLSARENLLLSSALLSHGDETAVDKALDRVGLGRTEGIPLDSFSSGMRQRFALARLALLARDLILLDEPEAHLDAGGLALLQELLGEWKARGAAIVCATHASDRFLGLSDIEVRLVAGRPESATRGAA